MFIQIFDIIVSPIMNLPFKGALYDELANVFDIISGYPIVIRSGIVGMYWFFMNALIVQIALYFILLVLLDFTLRNPKYFMPWVVKVL